MILFAQDYGKHPTAIVDTTTKNTSFLKLAFKYKKMGIKNYAFILTLLNPRLQGVDPTSPDLTLEQKLAIKVECRNNPWYFLREVARVKGQGGAESVPFLANRGNIALFWSYLNHIDICLIQPRQTGKSVGADFVALWVMMFGGLNSSINLITLTEKLRVQNVVRIKSTMKLLPKYLQDFRKEDSDNSQIITYKSLKNTFNTFVNQSSEEGARATARGFTSGTNMMDEWAYYQHVKATMAGALGSSLAARDEAEIFGVPYGNIFTTTAGKRDSKQGKLIYDMIVGGMAWSETLFDCVDGKDAMRIVKLHTTGGKVMINATLSHTQLGKSEAWLQETLGSLGLSDDDADRDLFNVWTNGSAFSPLSIELNRIISGSARDISYTEMSSAGYNFNWYIPVNQIQSYMANNKTVLGIDTSEIIGRDATTFILRDIKSLATIGTMAVSEGNLRTLSDWLADFVKGYENVTTIIERKSSAMTFIDTINISFSRQGINIFKRLFNYVVQEADSKPEEYKEAMDDRNIGNSYIYNKYKARIGFMTTAGSRDELYRVVLPASAKLAGHLTYDRELVSEITGLVVKNGKIDHKTSGHDDRVISWLLGHWLLSHGRNLNSYDIDPLQAMSMVVDSRKGNDPREQIEAMQRRVLRKKIDDTVSKLKSASDGRTIAILENQIKVLVRNTLTDGGERYSIDGMMQEAADSRRALLARQRFVDTRSANTDDYNSVSPSGLPWYYGTAA